MQIQSAEELQRAREDRLRRTASLCARAHPFYRRRFAEAGIPPDGIRTLDDLARLPLTHKSDYMAAPGDFMLDPAAAPELSLEERTLWNVAYTTGTTSGRPSPFYNTTHDQYHIMLQARACSETEGVRRGDIFANLYPLSPMPLGAFLCCVRTAEIMGLPIVSTLTGTPHPEYPVRRGLDEAVDVIGAARATILWGIPSFVRRVLQRAREKEVPLPGARMVVAAGEAVSPSLREEYMDHLRHFGAGDPQVRSRYSATEMQGGLVQCRNEAAPHNVVPELYYLEVVDPETGKQVPEGEEGCLAVTHLHRRGTVFLRYLIGDLIALKMEPCPHCGRLGERIVRAPRRTGDLVKVRGVLINPGIVFDVVSADRAVREYQLLIRKERPGDSDSLDEMVLRLEAQEADHPRLAAEMPVRIQRAVMVRPRVEFAAPGEVHDPLKSVKVRRLVDERDQ
ncbi:MAG: phenylacetate--CoA ligase family protein [Candidatus Tectomicrobia bacterium]|uniref:Phenylacetate--CoA ligase family protein n=1 Tax=Tectimicrobiota bacterium TaxID=2528274 RepID=A0A932HXB3_UNCTE|nr:phenylacetate--CoA ligase family protein [Candidatus Tectomicrobia bacterium]